MTRKKVSKSETTSPSETAGNDVAPPKECLNCENINKVRQKLRVSGLLQNAIDSLDDRIMNKDFKPTVAEYLKLMQLEQEAEQDMPKEIKVTWVDPTGTSNSEK